MKREFSWDLINLSIITVIVVNYFNIYWHYWFVTFLGGTIVKLWIPPALLLSLIGMKNVILNQQPSLKKDRIFPVKILCCIYIVFGILSLVAHDGGLWYIGKYSLFMFMPVVIFGIIIGYCKSNELIEKVLQTLFICGLLISFHTEFLYLFGIVNNQSIGASIGGIDVQGSADLFQSNLGNINRHTMPGLGINTYAAMLPPLALIGLFMGFKNNGFLKYFFFLSFLFLSYAILATLSRSAFIALIIGLLVFIWFTDKNKYFLFFIVCSSVFIMVLSNAGVLLRIIGPLLSYEFFANSDYLASIAMEHGLRTNADPHITIIDKSLSIARENPIFGAGMNKMLSVNEHNRYVEIYATNGLLGIIPYVAIIIAVVLITRNVLIEEIKQNSQQKEIGIILFSGVIAFTFYMNSAPSEFYFYWIWFGLSIAWARNCDKNRRYFEKSLKIVSNP
tara:strand:- start:1367 stop:2710 length:1344 start_codon:yes stop_codon:yes gene_type:complete